MSGYWCIRGRSPIRHPGAVPIAAWTLIHRRWPWSDQRWAGQPAHERNYHGALAAPAAELERAYCSQHAASPGGGPTLAVARLCAATAPTAARVPEPGGAATFSAWFTRLAGFADESTVPQQADLFARL